MPPENHPLRSALSDKNVMEQLLLKDRAFDAAAEGITIADALAEDRPLIYINEGFSRLTGYSVEETLGSNCRFLQGPKTDPDAVRAIRNAIEEDRNCEVELINYRKDGTPFWNRLSITPIRDSSGRTTHLIGVQSDVSRRRRAEQNLIESNASLAAANLRMKNELMAAAKIQQALLPTSIPQLDDIQVAWAFRPCDELAGDILDVLTMKNNQFAFYLLDVCGHGVAAALLSTTLSCWLSRMPLELRQNPVAAVEQLNQSFQMNRDFSKFFTCCYAVLNPNNQTLQFVSAGHPAPILVRNNEAIEIKSTGFPVGIVPDPNYHLQEISYQHGDRIYLYSDGAIEQADTNGEMFGMKRLMAELIRHRAITLQASIDETMQAVLQTASNNKNDDDVSILGIQIGKDSC
ncbi:MAG: SpoIIE family protein phosphatase [Phycisphaerales bacterium]|nr:SpoIIE family protein phosphatase [Phycisphaerales bacterium]